LAGIAETPFTERIVLDHRIGVSPSSSSRLHILKVTVVCLILEITKAIGGKRVMSALSYLAYWLGRDRGGEPRTNDG
jgi:hypothetical protein